MSIESQKHAEKTDVTVPDQVSKTEAAQAVFPNTKSREGFSTQAKVAATILTLGALAGGAAGVNYLSTHTEAVAPSDQNNDNNDKAPNATTSPTPEATSSTDPANIIPLETATPSVEQTAAVPSNLEIKAGQTPEALAKNVMENFTSWDMAGASPEATEATINYVVENGDTQLAAYFDGLAKKNSPAYVDALFEDPSSSIAKQTATNREVVNAWVLNMQLLTSNDQETYKLWTTVDSVEVMSEKGSERILRIHYTEHDNSNSGVNHANTLNQKPFDGTKHSMVVAFNSASGSEKISSMVIDPFN